jgi:hypothetical protein
MVRFLEKRPTGRSESTRARSPVLGDEAWAAPAGHLGYTLIDLQAYSACQALLIYSMVITTFSPSVPFFRIPNSLRGLTQLVMPVDNWRDLSIRHELAYHG